jgi:hypothetical protein
MNEGDSENDQRPLSEEELLAALRDSLDRAEAEGRLPATAGAKPTIAVEKKPVPAAEKKPNSSGESGCAGCAGILGLAILGLAILLVLIAAMVKLIYLILFVW